MSSIGVPRVARKLSVSFSPYRAKGDYGSSCFTRRSFISSLNCPRTRNSMAYTGHRTRGRCSCPGVGYFTRSGYPTTTDTTTHSTRWQATHVPCFAKEYRCVSRLAWVRCLPLCPVRLGEATQWHRFRCLRRGDASANQAMAIARDENEAHPSTALGLAGEKPTHACVLLGSSRAWSSASAVASAPIAPSSLSVGRWGFAFGLPPHLSDSSRSYSPKGKEGDLLTYWGKEGRRPTRSVLLSSLFKNHAFPSHGTK